MSLLLALTTSAGPTTFVKSLSYSAVGTVTLQKEIRLFRSLSALGTPVLQKQVNLLRSVVALGSVSLQKQVNLFRSFSAVGTVSLLTSLLLQVVKTFSAVGTSVMTALYIPAPPAVAAAFQAVRRFFNNTNRQ